MSRSKSSGALVLILGIITLLAVGVSAVVIFAVMGNTTATNVVGTVAGSEESNLRAMARKELLAFVKYPDNAKFHWTTEKVQRLKSGRMSVTGKAEIMNGFGAKPILPWQVILEDAGKEWEASEVVLDHEVLYSKANDKTN